MDIGVLELCGILGTLGTGFAVPFGLIKWCGAFVTKQIEDSEKKTAVIIDGHTQQQATSINNHTHTISNVKTRVDALERLRVTDIERVVKVETNLANLEKGQERIEHALDKMDADNAKGRAEIIDTIREMSKRELKA